MTQPLALVLYDRLLPGTQVVNRLQDLGYRVQTLSEADRLVESAERVKPLLVLADLESSGNNICAALTRLKQNPATQHLPILAFGAENTPDLQAAARSAGVTLIAGEAAMLNHLPLLLEQVLQVE
jgi:CheY-like chemotaxis protein